jgi:hypothetical protein
VDARDPEPCPDDLLSLQWRRKGSHKLGVEAGLRGEVGLVHQRSSGGGPTAALGAGFVATGSRARGDHASCVAIARWDQHRTSQLPVMEVAMVAIAQGCHEASACILFTMEWRWRWRRCRLPLGYVG